MSGLEIRPGLVLSDDEIRVEPLRSGGPGGQNVNKVSSGVMLRFDVAGSRSFDEAQRALVLDRLGSRLTKEGVLVLRAVEHREHARNLGAARERLRKLIAESLHRPPPRKKTRATRGSRLRRLDAKRRTGARKAERRGPGDSDA